MSKNSSSTLKSIENLNLKDFGVKDTPPLFQNINLNDIHDPLPPFESLTVEQVYADKCLDRPRAYKYVILKNGQLVVTSEYSLMMELSADEISELAFVTPQRFEYFHKRFIEGKSFKAFFSNINDDEIIFEGDKPKWKRVAIKHPEIAKLEPVIFAGDFYVFNGEIARNHPSGRNGINNWTGHYLCYGDYQQTLVEHVFERYGFQAKGRFIDEVDLKKGTKMPKQPLLIRDWRKAEESTSEAKPTDVSRLTDAKLKIKNAVTSSGDDCALRPGSHSAGSDCHFEGKVVKILTEDLLAQKAISFEGGKKFHLRTIAGLDVFVENDMLARRLGNVLTSDNGPNFRQLFKVFRHLNQHKGAPRVFLRVIDDNAINKFSIAFNMEETLKAAQLKVSIDGSQHDCITVSADDLLENLGHEWMRLTPLAQPNYRLTPEKIDLLTCFDEAWREGKVRLEAMIDDPIFNEIYNTLYEAPKRYRFENVSQQDFDSDEKLGVFVKITAERVAYAGEIAIKYPKTFSSVCPKIAEMLDRNIQYFISEAVATNSYFNQKMSMLEVIKLWGLENPSLASRESLYVLAGSSHQAAYAERFSLSPEGRIETAASQADYLKFSQVHPKELSGIENLAKKMKPDVRRAIGLQPTPQVHDLDEIDRFAGSEFLKERDIAHIPESHAVSAVGRTAQSGIGKKPSTSKGQVPSKFSTSYRACPAPSNVDKPETQIGRKFRGTNSKALPGDVSRHRVSPRHPAIDRIRSTIPNKIASMSKGRIPRQSLAGKNVTPVVDRGSVSTTVSRTALLGDITPKAKLPVSNAAVQPNLIAVIDCPFNPGKNAIIPIRNLIKPMRGAAGRWVTGRVNIPIPKNVPQMRMPGSGHIAEGMLAEYRISPNGRASVRPLALVRSGFSEPVRAPWYKCFNPKLAYVAKGGAGAVLVGVSFYQQLKSEQKLYPNHTTSAHRAAAASAVIFDIGVYALGAAVLSPIGAGLLIPLSELANELSKVEPEAHRNDRDLFFRLMELEMSTPKNLQRAMDAWDRNEPWTRNSVVSNIQATKQIFSPLKSIYDVTLKPIYDVKQEVVSIVREASQTSKKGILGLPQSVYYGVFGQGLIIQAIANLHREGKRRARLVEAENYLDRLQPETFEQAYERIGGGSPFPTLAQRACQDFENKFNVAQHQTSENVSSYKLGGMSGINPNEIDNYQKVTLASNKKTAFQPSEASVKPTFSSAQSGIKPVSVPADVNDSCHDGSPNFFQKAKESFQAWQDAPTDFTLPYHSMPPQPNPYDPMQGYDPRAGYTKFFLLQHKYSKRTLGDFEHINNKVIPALNALVLKYEEGSITFNELKKGMNPYLLKIEKKANLIKKRTEKLNKLKDSPPTAPHSLVVVEKKASLTKKRKTKPSRLGSAPDDLSVDYNKVTAISTYYLEYLNEQELKVPSLAEQVVESIINHADIYKDPNCSPENREKAYNELKKVYQEIEKGSITFTDSDLPGYKAGTANKVSDSARMFMAEDRLAQIGTRFEIVAFTTTQLGAILRREIEKMDDSPRKRQLQLALSCGTSLNYIVPDVIAYIIIRCHARYTGVPFKPPENNANKFDMGLGMAAFFANLPVEEALDMGVQLGCVSAENRDWFCGSKARQFQKAVAPWVNCANQASSVSKLLSVEKLGVINKINACSTLVSFALPIGFALKNFYYEGTGNAETSIDTYVKEESLMLLANCAVLAGGILSIFCTAGTASVWTLAPTVASAANIASSLYSGTPKSKAVSQAINGIIDNIIFYEDILEKHRSFFHLPCRLLKRKPTNEELKKIEKRIVDGVLKNSEEFIILKQDDAYYLYYGHLKSLWNLTENIPYSSPVRYKYEKIETSKALIASLPWDAFEDDSSYQLTKGDKYTIATKIAQNTLDLGVLLKEYLNACRFRCSNGVPNDYGEELIKSGERIFLSVKESAGSAFYYRDYSNNVVEVTASPDYTKEFTKIFEKEKVGEDVSNEGVISFFLTRDLGSYNTLKRCIVPFLLKDFQLHNLDKLKEIIEDKDGKCGSRTEEELSPLKVFFLTKRLMLSYEQKAYDDIRKKTKLKGKGVDSMLNEDYKIPMHLAFDLILIRLQIYYKALYKVEKFSKQYDKYIECFEICALNNKTWYGENFNSAKNLLGEVLKEAMECLVYAAIREKNSSQRRLILAMLFKNYSLCGYGQRKLDDYHKILAALLYVILGDERERGNSKNHDYELARSLFDKVKDFSSFYKVDPDNTPLLLKSLFKFSSNGFDDVQASMPVSERISNLELVEDLISELINNKQYDEARKIIAEKAEMGQDYLLAKITDADSNGKAIRTIAEHLDRECLDEWPDKKKITYWMLFLDVLTKCFNTVVCGKGSSGDCFQKLCAARIVVIKEILALKDSSLNQAFHQSLKEAQTAATDSLKKHVVDDVLVDALIQKGHEALRTGDYSLLALVKNTQEVTCCKVVYADRGKRYYFPMVVEADDNVFSILGVEKADIFKKLKEIIKQLTYESHDNGSNKLASQVFSLIAKSPEFLKSEFKTHKDDKQDFFNFIRNRLNTLDRNEIRKYFNETKDAMLNYFEKCAKSTESIALYSEDGKISALVNATRIILKYNLAIYVFDEQANELEKTSDNLPDNEGFTTVSLRYSKYKEINKESKKEENKQQFLKLELIAYEPKVREKPGLGKSRWEQVVYAADVKNDLSFSPSPFPFGLHEAERFTYTVGDCLFSAAASFSEEHSCTGLRRKTVDYMREHSASFENFVPYDEVKGTLKLQEGSDVPESVYFEVSTYDEYLSAMARPLVWGGELELKALANLLEKPVVVVRVNAVDISDNDVYLPLNYDHQNLDVTHIISLGFTGNHYLPLKLSMDVNEKSAFKQKIVVACESRSVQAEPLERQEANESEEVAEPEEMLIPAVDKSRLDGETLKHRSRSFMQASKGEASQTKESQKSKSSSPPLSSTPLPPKKAKSSTSKKEEAKQKASPKSWYETITDTSYAAISFWNNPVGTLVEANLDMNIAGVAGAVVGGAVAGVPGARVAAACVAAAAAAQRPRRNR